MRLFGISCVTVSCLLGCLDDPPTYEAPVRVPPVVVGSQVQPPLAVIYRLQPGEDTLDVSVPFQSEDFGSPILGKFLLDVQPGVRPPRSVLDVVVAASDFSDRDRRVEARVSGLSALEGCHSLTLVLTHQSNTISFTDELEDESLATRVVWWLAAPRADGREVLLGDCPTRGEQLGSGQR